jgi:galactokinase
MNGVAGQLSAAGMSRTEAAAKGRLFERALRAMPEGNTSRFPLRGYYVPGRIEVLGKHTDYGGGRSLLCAVEKGFCLVARERADSQVHVINARSRSCCVLALDPMLQMPDLQWCTYPATVARRLARNFPGARRGAEIAFLSDLPAASGMSSSSAFMVAVYLALAGINQLSDFDEYQREIRGLEDLAGYLGTVENGQSFGTLAGDHGVGTFGGSEDHTAILCCRGGELRQYSFCPIRLERAIAWPEGLALVVGVSGIVAMKTGAARDRYNHASLSARAVLQAWRAATGRDDPTLASAIASAPNAPDRLRNILRLSDDKEYGAPALMSRFEHFLDESTAIIPSAADALVSGDLEQFGAWVDRSQSGAENLLGNQVPETIALARSARALGALAASAFGAGFGGSVWALVKAGEAREFVRAWASAYRNRFPGTHQARFFSTRPGPAAQSLAL